MLVFSQKFKQYADLFRNELINNIFPFWLENGLDKVHGGIYTCLDREGHLMDTDKSVWFQGRAAWIFSYAYSNVEPRKEWLNASKSCIDFIEKHCFDADGRMFFQITKDGVPVRKRRYVFSETFAAIAFAQYAIAANNQEYALKALNLFNFILETLETPGALEPKFREGFVAKGHSICMILINTAYCIREAIDSPILTEQIDKSIEELRRDFMKPEFGAILETVGPNGEFIDSIAGRTINPGHSIETGWFILEEAAYRGWSKKLVEMGTTIIDWSWNWGWDIEKGGMQYFKDCRKMAPQEYWHDMKFWWPQNEAVIANLYAFWATGNQKYLERFELANDFQFQYLKDRKYKEWFGYLHYNNTPSQTAKGNFYKGPFHIPRMLIKCYMLCNCLEAKYSKIEQNELSGHR